MDNSKKKITQIFRYLKELSIGTNPKLDLSSYSWKIDFSDLADKIGVSIEKIDSLERDSEETIVKIKKVKETECPALPATLDGWVVSDLSILSEDVNVLELKNEEEKNGQIVTVNFRDSEKRVSSLAQWKEKRSKWLLAEKPVRESNLVFAHFFGLHAQLQREMDQVQLYLADCFLIWKNEKGDVNHPIILKKVELAFNPQIPEFRIIDVESLSFLYTDLLRFLEVDGKGIKDCKEYLENKTDFHPLSNHSISEFSEYFVNRFFTNGKTANNKVDIATISPVTYSSPLIFLGNKSNGFADVMDKLINSIPEMPSIPEALLRVVGDDTKKISADPNPQERGTEGKHQEEIDFLFTKPYNTDQKNIITDLDRNGSVIVQGPPGTGKTHTIANIIGHYLAQGKSILVTSHTTKSLKVLREKVVDSLRPLCVAVLNRDSDSKSQLKESVEGIISYSSKTNVSTLDNEIIGLKNKKDQLKNKINELELKLVQAKKNEYSDLVVSGVGISPSDAARELKLLEHEHGWISTPVDTNVSFPILKSELDSLYSTNSIATQDEEILEEGLPSLEFLISPIEFAEKAKNYNSLRTGIALNYIEFWKDTTAHDFQGLISLIDETKRLFSQKWLLTLAEESFNGSEKIQGWETLINLVDNAKSSINQLNEAVLKYGPKRVAPFLLNELEIVEDIVKYLEENHSIGPMKLLFNPKWNAFISTWKVDSGHPELKDHFVAILSFLRIGTLREGLVNRWERQVVAIGGPKLESGSPEVFASRVLASILDALKWKENQFKNIHSIMLTVGFDFSKSFKYFNSINPTQGEVVDFLKFAKEILKPSIDARIEWYKLKNIEQQINDNLIKIKSVIASFSSKHSYLRDLLEALKNKNDVLFSSAFSEFLRLKSIQEQYLLRTRLLSQLKSVAPNWATEIASRTSEHGENNFTRELENSWRVAQIKTLFDAREKIDVISLQRKIGHFKDQMNLINAEYIEKLAWSAQLKKIGLKEQQALNGWLQIQNKITKTGRGVRDKIMIKAGKDLLSKCKDAVPVWIMPLDRVYESYDFSKPTFDILILDEASQSDISALGVFALAEKVIVVGDDQQVTPQAVGQGLDRVQSLINELLVGVPNKELFDGKTSIYDVASQSFGETIRLVEHFRCVPDIINFSNELSYRGTIKPLREGSSSPFRSHVVSHRVQGVVKNKKNIVEAEEIASLIVSMTEFKEYNNSTFGVISLLGNEQSNLIDSILQEKLSLDLYEKHKILCGNSAQFQGDERNVVFISLVNSCEEPPMSIVQNEPFKKILNVAVSRAQDQLWVVHSLNPDTDLKPGDFRLKLIRHAMNPRELASAIAATQKKADPKSAVFEPSVISDLMMAGFRVTPQVRIGSYIIDIVVEGKGKRIAVECDGDKYHPEEKFFEDQARQQVLERLKWRFIRIRGSEYFRDRDRTIKRVVEELDALGVEKLGLEESQEDVSVKDILKEKIIYRANQIRSEWGSMKVGQSLDLGKPKKQNIRKKMSPGAAALEIDLENEIEEQKNSIFENIKQSHTSPDHKED